MGNHTGWATTRVAAALIGAIAALTGHFSSAPTAMMATEPDSGQKSAIAQAPGRTPIKSGQFVAGEHPTRGKVHIVTQNNQLFLELDPQFQTSNMGPDLVVALHRSPNVLKGTTPPAYPLSAGDYVVLAPLQKFSGAQRYRIPANVNVNQYQSAVIWCRRFNATFGAAAFR